MLRNWAIHLFPRNSRYQANTRSKYTSVSNLIVTVCRTLFQFTRTSFGSGHGPGRNQGRTILSCSSEHGGQSAWSMRRWLARHTSAEYPGNLHTDCHSPQAEAINHCKREGKKQNWYTTSATKRLRNPRNSAPALYRVCEGDGDVVGVVTHLVRGGAQVLHGDQVVELSGQLEVQEK